MLEITRNSRKEKKKNGKYATTKWSVRWELENKTAQFVIWYPKVYYCDVSLL